ncbi:MAG TPA: HEPN domain-containing protein [Candidatus Goldiibacteriota bacterium]|nr:HEPN domain-containing protein [Candidatus Goldiibacteriota bacterium]
MKELTCEWINKAEEDYIIAIRESRTEPVIYNAVCFHCKQSVEKYLKAYLQEMNIEFEKTHDIGFLYEKVKDKLNELSDCKEDFDELSLWAVEIRCPGISAEKEDAKKIA